MFESSEFDFGVPFYQFQDLFAWFKIHTQNLLRPKGSICHISQNQSVVSLLETQSCLAVRFQLFQSELLDLAIEQDSRIEMLWFYEVWKFVSACFHFEVVQFCLAEEESGRAWLPDAAGEIRHKVPEHEEHEECEKDTHPARPLRSQLECLPFSLGLLAGGVDTGFLLRLWPGIWALGVVRIFRGVEVLAVIWFIGSLPVGLGSRSWFFLLLEPSRPCRPVLLTLLPAGPESAPLCFFLVTVPAPIKGCFGVFIGEVFVCVGDLMKEFFGFWIEGSERGK